MPQIEPTYLRYTNDQLLKGKLNSKNPAGLPDGFTGIYEEVFNAIISLKERKTILLQMAVWALLKKEVSTQFVAEVLEAPLENIQELIAHYSFLFNSPESGKYQLYHGRLKVYLLQKLSKWEVNVLHEKLIARLEKAIEEQKADEFEWYGLEFLSEHMLVLALSGYEEYKTKVKRLALNESFQDRQQFISDEFNWSKNTIKYAVCLFTFEQEFQAEQNKNSLLILGNKLIEQFYREQNNAPAIINYITLGKPDLALKRINSFIGESENDQQRSFVLFILCIMELLDTQDSTLKVEQLKQFCQKLNTSQTHKFKRFDIIPHRLLFDLACKLEEVDIEHSPITDNIVNWEFSWIKGYPEFDKSSFNTILKLLNSETDVGRKNLGLSLLSIRLCELDKFEKSLFVFEMITNEHEEIDLPF